MTTLSMTCLDEGIYVGGQLYADDIPELSRLGIVAIICNRPDGEEEGQPSFASIARAAQAHGIVVHHVPVVSGHMVPANIEDMAAVLRQSSRPLFIYCRSGSRSKHLYQLALTAQP